MAQNEFISEKFLLQSPQALELYEHVGQSDRAAQMHSRLGRDLSSYMGYAGLTHIGRALEHFRAAMAVLGKGEERAPLGYLYVSSATAALCRSSSTPIPGWPHRLTA